MEYGHIGRRSDRARTGLWESKPYRRGRGKEPPTRARRWAASTIRWHMTVVRARSAPAAAVRHGETTPPRRTARSRPHAYPCRQHLPAFPAEGHQPESDKRLSDRGCCRSDGAAPPMYSLGRQPEGTCCRRDDDHRNRATPCSTPSTVELTSPGKMDKADELTYNATQERCLVTSAPRARYRPLSLRLGEGEVGQVLNDRRLEEHVCDQHTEGR